MNLKIENEEQLLQLAQQSLHLLVNYRALAEKYLSSPTNENWIKLNSAGIKVDGFVSKIAADVPTV